MLKLKYLLKEGFSHLFSKDPKAYAFSTKYWPFQNGPVEIWYMKPSFFRDGNMGLNWLVKQNKEVLSTNYKKTHIFLGKVPRARYEELYKALQGEYWSPEGEANYMIRAKGLGHTSMSVGDLIVDGKDVNMVDNFGFTLLADKPVDKELWDKLPDWLTH